MGAAKYVYQGCFSLWNCAVLPSTLAASAQTFPDMLTFPNQHGEWRTAINRAVKLGVRATRCANKINDRLYLSDYWTARDDEEVQKLGVTHIVSVIDRQPSLPEAIPASNRLLISIADSSDADILSYLDETTAFITKALEENEDNKVLVHCLQGISRSATVVCAYLIATEGMNSQEAIDHVQTLRPVVCPNLGFRLQLMHYSERFRKRQGEGKCSSFGKEFIQRCRKFLSPDSQAKAPLPVIPEKSMDGSQCSPVGSIGSTVARSAPMVELAVHSIPGSGTSRAGAEGSLQPTPMVAVANP